MSQKVRAKRNGFYGGVRRRAGTVFTVKAGTELGKWMEPLGIEVNVVRGRTKAEVKAEAEVIEPNTLSEMTAMEPPDPQCQDEEPLKKDAPKAAPKKGSNLA